MAGVQPRDESVGDSSEEEEPLSTLAKCKRTPERTKHSEEAQSPRRSSEDERISKLSESKGSPPAGSDRHHESAAGKEPSNSEDDQSVKTQGKKRRTRKKPDREVTDANKTKHSRKDMTEAKASKLRQSSPPGAKAPQKRGRKGKGGTRRMASVHSKPETPRKRGRPKKEDRERKAPSGESSDEEPLTHVVKRKKQPEMKQAVVLLRRMSKSDIMDAITQSHTHSQERSSALTAGAEHEARSSDEEPPSRKVKRLKRQSKPVRNKTATDASSEDEPLARRMKAAPVKNKCGKRTNGEEDTPKKESELGEELKTDSDAEHLAKKKSDRAAQSLHRETSSS